MKRLLCRPSRGIALLLVIGAVAILSILAIELSHRANLEVTRSARTSREATFRRAFDSGIEIAKAMLSERRKSDSFDYWGDGWNKQITTDLDGAKITLWITDESGKLNISDMSANSDARAAKSLSRL